MSSSNDESRSSSGLGRLDERVVPVLQRGARAIGRVLTAPFHALSRFDGLAGGRFAGWLWRHRQGLVFVTAVLVFAGSYVHVQRYGADEQAQPAAAPAPGVTASGDDGALPGGTSTFVGPDADTDLAAYVEEQEAELAEAAAASSRVAVVSFSSYLNGSQTADVLPDALTVRKLLMRVPAEEQDPFTVDVAPDASVAEVVSGEVSRIREDVATQEAEITELLESDTVDDPEYKRFYEAEVERLAGIRNLLGSDGAIVYAAVVRGEVAALRELAAMEAVRLVDLAPAELDVDASTFEGLLPERGQGP